MQDSLGHHKGILLQLTAPLLKALRSTTLLHSQLHGRLRFCSDSGYPPHRELLLQEFPKVLTHFFLTVYGSCIRQYSVRPQRSFFCSRDSQPCLHVDQQTGPRKSVFRLEKEKKEKNEKSLLVTSSAFP